MNELGVFPTTTEHRNDIPTTPSIVSEPVNIDAKTTRTVSTPINIYTSAAIVEHNSTCAPSKPECRAQQSPSPVCHYLTRLTRDIPSARLDL